MIAVYINNHTAVWGSWYEIGSGQWGFACCHSTVHLSYCTGEAGILATKASSAQSLLTSSTSAPPAPQESMPPPSDPDSNNADDRRKKAEALFSKKRLGEGELQLDNRKLAEALQTERKRKGRDNEDEWTSNKKKAGGSHEVTEEELGMQRFPQSSLASTLGHLLISPFYRGLQDESPRGRGSHGELRGRRVVMVIYLPLQFSLFSTHRDSLVDSVYYHLMQSVCRSS